MENNKWFFGNNAGLDFNTSPPTPITGTMIASEGCSSIADANGNLLFYTNGATVYNASHNVMANGSGLNANLSATQAALIIRKPLSSNEYFVFSNSSLNVGLYYSIVDMSLAGGQGSVTVKNIPLSATCSEKLAGTYHANGTDIWVVFADLNGDYNALLVTPAGVSTIPVISPIGGPDFHFWGQLKFSVHGKKAAAACQKTCHIFDFDNTTGQLTNQVILQGPPGHFFYGCEFSPDASRLYSSYLYSVSPGSGLIQWSTCGNSTAAIAASSVVIANTFEFSSLQLGPDGRIYTCRSTSTTDLGVINFPNSQGAACGYSASVISVAPNICTSGLPNQISAINTPPAMALAHTVNPPFGCQTATFSIHNLSMYACAPYPYSVDSIKWDFGDPASGPANVSTHSVPIHPFSSTGTYTVRAVVYFCCNNGSDTLAEVVTISKQCLTVLSESISCSTAGSATAIVEGGTGPFSYTWIPGGFTTSVVSGIYPGTYSVFAYDQATNITSSLTVDFSSSPPFTGSVQVIKASACDNKPDGAAAIAGLSGGTGNTIFFWTNGSDSITATQPTVSTLAAGVWTLNVADTLSHCSFSRTFQITNSSTPGLTVSPAQATVCAGKPVQLQAFTDAELISWIPSNGLTNVTGSITTANPSSPVIYSVAAHNQDCKTETTVTVNARPSPTLQVIATKTAYCINDEIPLSATGAENYTWTPPAGIQKTGSVVTFSGHVLLSGQVFSVTGTDSYGCTAELQTSIVPLAPPKAELLAYPLAGCVPFCTDITFKPENPHIIPLSWPAPENNSKNTYNICYEAPGDHPVSSRFIDTLTGCLASRTLHIDAREKPVADFTWEPEKPLALEDEVTIVNTSRGESLTDTRWYLNMNLDRRNTERFSYIFQTEGSYQIFLVVSNTWGCADTAQKSILVKPEFAFYIPSSFTPNNDNRNDLFFPVSRGVKDFRFIIFNRWGQEIYSFSAGEAGWDGKHQSKPCEQGLYVWSADVQKQDGEQIKLTGSVFLIR